MLAAYPQFVDSCVSSSASTRPIDSRASGTALQYDVRDGSDVGTLSPEPSLISGEARKAHGEWTCSGYHCGFGCKLLVGYRSPGRKLRDSSHSSALMLHRNRGDRPGTELSVFSTFLDLRTRAWRASVGPARTSATISSARETSSAFPHPDRQRPSARRVELLRLVV